MAFKIPVYVYVWGFALLLLSMQQQSLKPAIFFPLKESYNSHWETEGPRIMGEMF